MTRDEIVDRFESSIKQLNDATWEGRIELPVVREWVNQFSSNSDLEKDEQIHALFLLSNFLYFGQQEVRELLTSMYRDLFKSARIREIRKNNGDTLDKAFIAIEYRKILDKTRFLGIGNPSESGCHLLYYFRQQNILPKYLFVNTHEIFSRDNSAQAVNLKLRDNTIEHYVFIDDLCGSGTQARLYSRDIVEPLRILKPSAKVTYLVLFATSTALAAIRKEKLFDEILPVFELDSTFRSLDIESRIFSGEQPPIVRERVRETCEKYGTRLSPGDPLGYRDGQLLLGFSHNTPDNTLPIFWAEEADTGPWLPIFKRYNKDYGQI